jgi:hypothetical protein
MNEDDWLSFYSATGEMEQRSGLSRAVARKQVRQACADQLITSMKAPCDDGHRLPFEFWKRIAPKEWREREVDYDGPDKDGCETEVMIREDDYRYWLNGATNVRSKGSSKRDLARRAINDIWSGDIPIEISNKQIAKQVGEHLKQQGRSDIGSDTILRAAGRK